MAKALTMADLMGTATEQTVTTGSTINGKILSVKKNEILIDMGPHGVGLVPRREIGFGKKYNVGDEVGAWLGRNPKGRRGGSHLDRYSIRG